MNALNPGRKLYWQRYQLTQQVVRANYRGCPLCESRATALEKCLEGALVAQSSPYYIEVIAHLLQLLYALLFLLGNIQLKNAIFCSISRLASKSSRLPLWHTHGRLVYERIAGGVPAQRVINSKGELSGS